MRVTSPADWSTRTRFVAIGVLLVITAVLLFWAGTWDNDSERVEPTPSPSPSPSTEALLQQVGDAATLPTAAGLAAVLTPLLADPDLGQSVSVSVTDAVTGTSLYGASADQSLISASVVKILTATAALQSLSPEHRFQTTVLLQTPPNSAPVLTLVGGGDPGLGATAADTPTGGTLTELAAGTADALTARGITGPVELRYDDSLFVGANPETWPDGYVASGVVAPVSALSISRDEDEVVTDPAGRAAAAFATALTGAGVSVSGPPTRGAADAAQAAEVAAVESAQLSALVERMLETSNNDYAEALGRHVAIATGAAGTSSAATLAITQTVAGLGVDVTGAALADASGLSRSTRLPAQAVTDTLTVAAADATAVAAGMSVAGFSGTLAERFDTTDSEPGAGLVRGKTGTLTGVSSLAGLVVDADGRLLAFAVIADAVPPGATLAARDALDQVAAALATCGCR